MARSLLMNVPPNHITTYTYQGNDSCFTMYVDFNSDIEIKKSLSTLHFSKGYKALLATTDGIYCGTPTTIDGKYPGGLSTNLTDDIRLLYNGGCVSGVSVIRGDDTIGSMVSGYGEIYDYAPIGWESI